jgi:hypothetical protein
MAIAIPIAASSTPNFLTANEGRIGMSIPNPRRSIKTVRKISGSADLFFTLENKLKSGGKKFNLIL